MFMMTRLFRTIAASLALGVCATTASAFPSGFFAQQVGDDWTGATGLTFAADGKMFVWEKRGRIYRIENGIRILVLNIGDEVADWRDHGLLGVTLHPDFLNNGYIYLLYAVDRYHLYNSQLGGYDPGVNEYFAPSIGRLTRYTINTANFNDTVNNSRLVLIGDDRTNGIPLVHESHGVGSLAFCIDGTMLVSTGDAASFAAVDNGGGDGGSYAPQARTDGILTEKEDVGAFRSQLVDSLNGKILRIDPETGDGVSSNPFYDAAAPRSARSRVWSLGLRNPFRMSVRPNTGSHFAEDGEPGSIYIGDVGWFLWEELNVATRPGENFGWPEFDGMNRYATYSDESPPNLDAPNPLGCQSHFTFRDLIVQETLTASPSFPNPCNGSVQVPATLDRFVHSRPRLDWDHGSDLARVRAFNGINPTVFTLGDAGSPVSGTSFQGACATGGVWYTGSVYPSMYQNTYFLADFSSGWIRNLVFDANDELQEVRTFGFGGNVVAFAMNPVDGCLYFIRYGQKVFKLEYAPTGNLPPTAVALVDQNYGPAPLSVSFTGSGSIDPESLPLDYFWDFGDGNTSTDANPTHVFTTPDSSPTRFDVTLRVTDQSGEMNETSLIVSANNTPPRVTITSPIDGSFYAVAGQPTIATLDAVIDDDEHDEAQRTCEWVTTLHHNDHTHPEPPDANCPTTAFVTPFGCDGQTYFYRFQLTVTDDAGLTTTQFVDMFPDCGSNIELELMLPDSGATTAVVTPDDPNLTLYVRARVADDPLATGLVTFDGRLRDDGSGVFAPSALTSLEALGIDIGGLDPLGRTGMFPSYRATIAENNDDPGNGQPFGGEWAFLPLNLSFSGNGEGINGSWSNIYKLDWTTTDFSDRTIQMRADATLGGYQTATGLREPIPVAPGAFQVIVDSNSCPCEFDGDASAVTITDLLEFLSLWFDGNAGADYDGSGLVDVVDLLGFLACWFTASSGGPCA